MNKPHPHLNVVIALIWNHSKERILLSRRREEQDFSGFWEFPGGKVERDESPIDALKRELKEELNIEAIDWQYAFSHTHHYEHKSVTLIGYHLYHFRGSPIGNEGQEIAWSDPQTLNPSQFPAANLPIITAIKEGLE